MSIDKITTPEGSQKPNKLVNSKDLEVIEEARKRKAQEKANQAEQKAKLAARNLLEALHIKRVVYVDNYFDPDIERIVEAIVINITIDEGKVSALFPLFDFELPRSDWEFDIRQHWETLVESERKDFFAELRHLSKPPEPIDTLAAKMLRGLVDIEGIDYKQVPPADWVENEKEWLSDAGDQLRILCLFDQEFSVNTGSSISNGIDLLQKTAQRVGANQPDYDGRILLGVYSHYFPIGGERQKGAQICREQGLKADSFLPLSKERAKEPITLAKGLQMLVLNQYAGKLKGQVKQVMQAACKEAGKRLDQLDVYEFDDIVLSSSLIEGVWEAETLVRLFSMLQVHHGRIAISQPSIAKGFNENVKTARALTPRLEQPTSRADLLSLRRLELYTESDSLNAFHFTLRSGDIFRDNAGNRYLLLAQPCDLMVRSDGSRGSALPGVDLFLISELAENKVKSEEGIGVLKHFSHIMDSVNFGIINFKKRRSVPIDVLDLAVINANGRCRVDLNSIGSSSIPVQFHPAWAARYEVLLKTFKQIVVKLDALVAIAEKAGMAPEEITVIKTAQYDLLNPREELPSSPTYQSGVLDFGLTRDSHYRSPASDHLLASYAQFLSRAAEDHDFAKQPKREGDK